jgi:hypothetical protein
MTVPRIAALARALARPHRLRAGIARRDAPAQQNGARRIAHIFIFF